jgi:hypothetical protein
VLTETAARWLLLLHAAVGVAAVGAATHLAIWLRRYVRGQRRSVVRFAALTLGLQLAAVGAGLAVYPTYRVEVRAAYLERPEAIAAERALRQAALAELAAREGAPAPVLEEADARAARAARAARWFDVKEHWVALGLLASIALTGALAAWDPRRGPPIGSILLGIAVIVAATAWAGAAIGVLTAAWRAV